MRMLLCGSVLVMCFAASGYAVNVENEIVGNTYALANGFTATSGHPEGSHFHTSNLSSAMLPVGNPPLDDINQLLPDSAEVGGFFGDEEVRTVSEFSLFGQTQVAQATVLFDVQDLFALGLIPDPAGLGGVFGQDAYTGLIDLFVYHGDNFESVSDYEIMTLSNTPLTRIDASLLAAGQTLSVDVTNVFNDLVDNLSGLGASDALGVRLQMAPPADPFDGAITFHNFRLQTVPIPEPSGCWLAVTALLSPWRRTAFTRRLRSARS